MKGSLRTRLLAGALAWMAAVLVVVIAIVVKLSRNHPEFARRHMTHVALGLVALAFLIGGVLIISRALAPFTSLRGALSAVRESRAQKLEGAYPSEVQPLVDDLNALLEDRERAIARAQSTAGDLAHGLKTPLAVLAQEAERIGAAGHDELATTLAQQVERMQQQIDYHLARSRASASAGSAPGLRCAVLPSVEALVRTMQRLHAERHLSIEIDVAPDHELRGRREELEEMLGNLLDNACKWARSRVRVSSSLAGDRLVLCVDDDGSGLAPAMRAEVLLRGVRVDERERGSGLGLAIVSDLAELYGGTVALDASPLGGLRARLELPTR